MDPECSVLPHDIDLNEIRNWSCASSSSFNSLCAEGKVAKAEVGEVSQQHLSSKKERDREEQEINDSEEEGDLLEEEEEVRILCSNKIHRVKIKSLAVTHGFLFYTWN